MVQPRARTRAFALAVAAVLAVGVAWWGLRPGPDSGATGPEPLATAPVEIARAAPGDPPPPADGVPTAPAPSADDASSGDEADATEVARVPTAPQGPAAAAPSATPRPPAIDRPGSSPPPAPPTAAADAPPATGTLAVTAQPWARVAVDGRDVGTTPVAAVEVAAGVRTLTLRNPDFPPHTVRVEVAPGGRAEAAVSLWATVGRIDLEVSPWAAVAVDGAPWDTVPPQSRPLVLAPGDHVLTFTHPTLGSREVPLRVAAGERRTVRVRLGD